MKQLISKSTQHYVITQYLDGVMQYDPLLGGRDGFTVLTVPFGSHDLCERWVQEHSRGFVHVQHIVTSTKFRGIAGVHESVSPVRFEFEHPSDAMLCKLTFGGTN